MHSGGFELTELTYTRLEDNLIRHRGDRLTNPSWLYGINMLLAWMAQVEHVRRSKMEHGRGFQRRVWSTDRPVFSTR